MKHVVKMLNQDLGSETRRQSLEKCAQIQNADVLKQFLCSAFLNSRNHSVESGARRPYLYISLHFSAP